MTTFVRFSQAMAGLSVYVILYLYLPLISSTLVGEFCTEGYRRGFILTNSSVFRSQTHNTHSLCLKSCVATASCEAFTYHLPTLMCLYGTTGFELEPTIDFDFVTSPSQWNPTEYENNISPCTHTTCPSGSECHVIKNGNAFCIKSECPITSLQNAMLSSNDRMIGSTVGILCDDGFIHNGTLQKTCLADGTWTDVNTECKDCGAITHITDYYRARDYCLSKGKNLLHYDNAWPSLVNVSHGRCPICPEGLIADEFTRYMEDDCVLNSDYKNDTYCNCVFTTSEPGKKIRIESTFLDLEDDYDFLWIFDGPDKNSPILGEYSGNAGFNLTTSDSAAFILFHSDGGISHAGFRLSYQTVPSDSPSDTPTTLLAPDTVNYLWLEGYINHQTQEFVMPDGTFVFDMTSWNLEASDVIFTRICYDPFDDWLRMMMETDYCHTYCE
ncbi:uncharacterized protein [Argopecten irradians]|uniref:uncharacterized protein n=1 Tax=Argopecten irradians TaxID=31199 RepID=UPI0037124540